LKQKKNFGGIRRPRCPEPLFVGAKAFIKAATKKDAFLIYVLPSPDVEPCPHEISFQYQETKYVFEKRNANILLKHQLYNFTIHLVEGEQLPFKSIYNLSQDKLVMLQEYLEDSFEKGFI
jgi:hypothetical protein